MKKINVLLLDHQAEIYGVEVCLLELLRTLDKSRFTPVVHLVGDGPFRGRLEDAGIKTKTLHVPSFFRNLKEGPSGRGSPCSVGNSASISASCGYLDGGLPRDILSMGKSACVFPWLIKEIENFIIENNVDVVCANTAKSACFGILAAKKAKVRSVWILHEYLSRDFYHPLFLKAIKMFTKDADHVICVSEDVKKRYLDFSGCWQGKVSVVYNGVDLEEFSPRLSGEKIRREFSLGHKKVIGLVGRLEPWKGQKVFIKAAELALKHRDDVVFLMAGGALFGRLGYERECRLLVEERGLGDRVFF